MNTRVLLRKLLINFMAVYQTLHCRAEVISYMEYGVRRARINLMTLIT